MSDFPETVGPLINGVVLTDTSGGSYAVTRPANGSQLCLVSAAGQDEVKAAVGNASRAFDDGLGAWPRMPASERGRILLRAAELVRGRSEQLARIEAENVGKPIKLARYDVALVADVLEFWGGAASKIAGEVIPVTDRGLDVVLREPVGHCVLITPWNFPMVIATWKLAPALACGNTVVIKPASLTPISTIVLAGLLIEAGVPSDVISVLPGSGATLGDALVSHPSVAKISFTGSTEVGRHILECAAGDIKRVSLELGGKSASIVFADAKLDRCIEHSVQAVFGNAGQDCCARSRILVERPLYDEYASLFAKATSELIVGLPLDEATQVGPLVSNDQRAIATRYLELGQREGGRLLVGGDVPSVAGGEGGAYLNPAVLADVRNDMQVAQEEIFGPVACVIPFDTEDEAIRLANASRYGLSGSVWTCDLGRAMRVTRAMRTGVVSVNSFHSVHTEAPFGGFKQSGFGRELGMHAIELYTELKNVFFADYD